MLQCQRNADTVSEFLRDTLTCILHHMNTLSQYLLVLAYLIKSMDLYITGAITSDEVATSYRISNIYIPGSKGTDRPTFQHYTHIHSISRIKPRVSALSVKVDLGYHCLW